MRSRIIDMFRFDLRLLGLFRILLGALVIIDLVRRSFDLRTFYTDKGLFTRKLLLENDWNSWNFSLNLATGSVEGQALIFGVAIFCAAMVLIGLRTKLFLVLLYILIISIQTRNSQILHGGDTIIKLLIFYSIFLPVNTRYAIDIIKEETIPDSNTVFSIATIGYILQAISVYIFSGISKTGIEWINGTAVYYTLNLEIFTTPLASSLNEMLVLMELLNYSTLYFEKFGFLLLFIPFAWQYFRLTGVLLFMGLHFGFFLFLNLGNFPWAAIIMWVVLLPPMVADILETQANHYGISAKLIKWRDYIRIGLKQFFFNNILLERSYRKLGWLPSIFVGVAGVGVLCWNLGNQKIISNPPLLKKVVRTTGIWQDWNMFAPNPMKIDGWYIIDAQLQNGAHVDIFNDRPTVIYDKPDNIAETYGNERWQKYLVNMLLDGNKKYLGAWGKYTCSCWNEKHGDTDKELESFSIFFMKEITPAPGEPELIAKKTVIWNHWCKKEFRHRFQ